MENVILGTFPETEIEALAMLYVQNQDLKDVTPEKLLEMYDSAVKAMQNVRQMQQRAKEEWF